MKKLLFTLISVLLSFGAFAQNKMDAVTSIKLKNIENSLKESQADAKKKYSTILTSENSVNYLKCLVSVKDETAEQDLLNSGVKIILKAGDVWVIKVPIENVYDVAENSKIGKLELSQKGELYNYKSRIATNTENVHNGQTGQRLKGEGVVVGVVDTGIDLEHPDFQTDEGTRIKYIWDMSDQTNQNPPLNYDWGIEYSDADINAGSANHVDIYGHGTHVAGTAAGNGRGNPKHTGMAPESDIIFAKPTGDEEGNDFLGEAEIMSSVAWIFEKADELNQPAVANLSLGWSLGPKDGTRLVDKGLSNLSGEGKIVVAAAGNEGELFLHTGTTMEVGERYETLILPFNICDMDPTLCPDIDNIFATGSQIWFSPNSLDSIYVAAYGFDFETGGLGVAALEGFGKDDVMNTHEIIANGQTLGYIDIDFSNNFIEENNAGNTMIMIHNNGDINISIDDYFWSVIVVPSSEGRVDKWSGIPFPAGSGVEGVLGIQLEGNNEMTVGSPSTAKKVISVGSYVTEDFVEFDNGGSSFYEGEIDNISSFSSRGPTRDGRTAPDITAPGEVIISAWSKDSWSEGTVDEYYTPSMGTSMAAPAVAGIIALMLQVKPDLTYEEIIDIFEQTARTDNYTGEIPNNTWGWGKIDALQAIRLLVGANVEDYSGENNQVSVFPNPAIDNISISNFEPGMRFIIFDVNGNALMNFENTENINLKELSSGTYFLNVTKGLDSYAVPFTVAK